MSYILEALKKAEQKREQEQVQPFVGFGSTAPVAQKKRRWWPYVLIGALALNAGIMVWSTGLWQDDDRTPATEREASTPPPSAAAPAKSLPRVVVIPAPAQHGPVRAGEGERQSPQAGSGRQAQVAGNSTSPIARQDAPQAALPVPAKAPAENTSPKETAPIPERKPPKDRVFALSELPGAIRNALPQFKISGHAYTPEPQNRVVRINEKILQEGQDLIPGMKIEEIVASGVIMTYQGYRFRVPVANR